MDLQLNATGSHSGVNVLSRTSHNLAGYSDNKLRTQPLSDTKRRFPFRLENNLHHTGVITKIDEDHPAVITTASHPTAEHYLLPAITS
jgi:hypothetical protein